MQPNCKTRMRIRSKIVQKTKLNPTLVRIQENLSLLLSYPDSRGSWGEARTGSPGDVHHLDWTAMGGKEYEVVPCVAAIAQWQTFIRSGTVYIQSHDLIYVKEAPQNYCTAKHTMFHDHNSIMIQREQEPRPAHATHWCGEEVWWRGATFATWNSHHCICSKKSVSLRVQQPTFKCV